MNAATRLLFASLFVLPLGFFGCSGKPAGDVKVIKIVSSLPRTGSAKQQTDSIVNGIHMALEEVDYKVGDFTIEYLDLDDATSAAGKWTAEREGENARSAVADADTMVYIGTYNSGAAKVSMPIVNRAGLLMVSPANTWPGFTKPGKGDPGEPEDYRPSKNITYVRVVPADDLQAARSAEWAKEMGLKNIFILDDNEVYGRGIARLFSRECQDRELTVLGHESVDANAQEFRSLMNTIKGKNPDLIYFGGTTQTKAGQVAKDMVAAGLTAKLMVPDGCYETAFIESAGADNLNDRCYVTFGGRPPEKLEGAGRKFVEKYTAKHKIAPEGYAVYGYESGKVAIEAIRRAGKKDRAAIVAACLAIKDFDGALGKWSFDANGDTSLTTVSANGVRNGKFEFIKYLGE